MSATPVKTASSVKLQVPASDPHPLRFAVAGVTDTLTNLQSFVSGLDWDPDFQSGLAKRIALLKSNAAQIHVHDVNRKDGGFDLHITVSGVKLGAGPASVIKPASELTALNQ